jgi:phage tail tape-measure protein
MATNLDDIQAKISVESDTSGVDDAKGALQDFGSVLDQIGIVAAGVALEHLAEKFVDFAGAVAAAAIQAGEQTEVIGISFQRAFGSQGGGLMDNLEKMSNGMTEQASQLDNIALKWKVAGMNMNNISPMMKDISDVAAATSTSIEETNQKFDTLGQIMATAYQRGSVTSMQLRGLLNQNIPIYDAITEVFRKQGEMITKSDLLHNSKNFKISAQTLGAAIQLMAKNDFGAAIDQSNTLQGTMINMRKAFSDMARDILGVSESGGIKHGSVFATLKQYAQEFMSFLNSHKDQIRTWFETELKVFLDYLIAHQADIQKFFTGMIKNLESLGSWIAANKDNITAILNALGSLANFGVGFSGAVIQGVPATLGAMQHNPMSLLTNQKTANITMHNYVNSPADWSSVARETAWRVNGR